MTGTIQDFNFSVDLLRSLLWEYNDATSLQSLVTQKQAWYDANQSGFWNDWVKDVFNLETANDFGLAVWSIILGAPITIVTQPLGPDDISWGFDDYSGNFDNYNFGGNYGDIIQMPTEMARLYLRLRYFQLTSSGTVPETNRMLKYIFGKLGNAYLQDNHNMTQTYVFDFPITSDMKFLFANYDVLPRPAGVESFIEDGTDLPWGFSPDSTNYDNGNFKN